MSDVTLNYTILDPTGYLSCKVPSDIFTVVKHEINNLIKTNFKTAVPYNNNLAGSIEYEYRLYECEDILNKFFKLVIPKYWLFNNMPEMVDNVYEIQKIPGGPAIWANFQKKYEYNPLHNHSGVLSFVLYINIPYTLEEERKQPHAIKNKRSMPPLFSFLYPKLGTSVNILTNNVAPVAEHFIKVDKSFEGKMIIFPAWLQHQVTPFYSSDDYRISISGNLVSVNNG